MSARIKSGIVGCIFDSESSPVTHSDRYSFLCFGFVNWALNQREGSKVCAWNLPERYCNSIQFKLEIPNISTKIFHFLVYIPVCLSLLLPDGHRPTSNICFHIIRRGHIAQPLMLFLGHSVHSCIRFPRHWDVRGKESSCGHFKMHFRLKHSTFTERCALFRLVVWMWLSGSYQKRSCNCYYSNILV